MAGRRSFGNIRKLPSGRYQARYQGPDGRDYTARKDSGAPLTFDSRQYADGYLSRVSASIQAGKWEAPNSEHARNLPVTLRAYSETWLEGRDLSPSTRLLYGNVLDDARPRLQPAADDHEHRAR
jgi:hypothetical protein